MIQTISEKMGPWLRSWGHRFREPRFGLEIAPESIRGVRLRPVEEGWGLDVGAEVALPADALALAFRGNDFPDVDALGAALSEMVGRLGARNARVAAALPDALVKLRIERFPALPDDPVEARRLAAWRVGKGFGMPAEELMVDLFPLGLTMEGEPEALVAAAHRPVIEWYEAVFRAAGLDSEPILPAAVARFNLHASEMPAEGTVVLLIFTTEYFHMLRMEGGRLARFQSLRGGLAAGHLARDLFLAAEQLRDELGDQPIDAVFLADPGAPLWELAPALAGLFDAPMTILRADRPLKGVARPREGEGPSAGSLGAAIGAAIGDRLTGGGVP
ncbi:MAG: type IV pilus biogenesis protein PilM [Thermodesulfobacteriota bacterium]